MRSMTGFGKAQACAGDHEVEVEARSVNHRFLKTSVRLPRDLPIPETEVETTIRKHVVRGSISIGVRLRRDTGAAAYGIDDATARSHAESAVRIASELGLVGSLDIGRLMALPGVVVPADADDSIPDELRALFGTVLEDALTALVEMRGAEGRRLSDDLGAILDRIASLSREIGERSPTVVTEHRERLTKRLDNLLEKLPVDQDAIAREVALFADRCDIAEELQRLGSHLDQFRSVVRSDEPVGKKLEFLVQELLRETNTIGSKANDYEIARRVVEMKSDIERVREQVQNIE